MSGENPLSVIHKGGIGNVYKGRPVRVLGIDLGTTNSTVSECLWDVDSTPPMRVRALEVVQSTQEGQYTHVLLPSVVAIHGGQVFVGEGAKRLRSRASELGLKQNQDLFYECKNDIGILRTYHRAPEGYRTAAEIGGKVLEFLAKAAVESGDGSYDRAVVTVPASFQAAQRYDTRKAADLAGLKLAGGDLLDEPIAAFLDYLIAEGNALASDFDQPRTVVVFDFGGGTCDVAVFRLHQPDGISGQLSVESLAVSRYHRLGGGDIDAAIVHEVLIPELCRQNDIRPADLTYEDKKIQIEPALLGLAEMLKVGLCIEIRRMTSFKKYAAADKQQVCKTQPGVHHCKLGERALSISSPKLTAAQFEDLLKPFLDRDLLYARETEYRLTCSIFAPLSDALDRAGLDQKQVDYCLIVGGSSLIPQVFDALNAFFPQGQVLTYSNRDDVKACVSRGAAYHAMALQVFGKGLVRPTCHDDIAVRTASGLVTLIPRGTSLPYPGDGSFAEFCGLAVPKSVLSETCEIRVELVATGDERRLLSGVWSIQGPVNQGASISLQYRLDENQVLELRACLADAEENDQFAVSVENPLTNVVNPEPKRMKIDVLEEEVRTGKVSKSDIPSRIAEIAQLYADIGQREKAIEFLKRAVRMKGAPNVYWLNRLADYYGMVGDLVRQEEIYREAVKVSNWAGTWFNLSLALKRQGRLSEAAEAIAQAIQRERDAPYLVQAGLVAISQEDTERGNSLLAEAMAGFNPIRSLSDWELGWFVTAVRTIGDQSKLAEARDEQRRRAQGGTPPPELGGELPIVAPAISRPKQ